MKEEEEIRNFAAQTDGFDFWNNPKEDLYQDYLIEAVSRPGRQESIIHISQS